MEKRVRQTFNNFVPDRSIGKLYAQSECGYIALQLCHIQFIEIEHL
jgi:hypothetical protein